MTRIFWGVKIMNRNIAIDGPSGAGKSTFAKSIARRLNYIYLDTGAMYRAFGLYAINNGVDFSEADWEKDINIDMLVDGFSLDVIYDNGEQRVLVNEEDVTSLIRTPAVSIAASKVAVIPTVRLKLVEIQRAIAAKSNVVMDGRDIGSYVLPDAAVKIFLTASPEVRAQRRYKELLEKNIQDVTYEEVLKDMIFRDKNDSTREFAPLVQAQDAILLDTSDLNCEESEAAMLDIIMKKLENK